MSREEPLNSLPTHVLNALSSALDLPVEALTQALEAAVSPDGYERFEFPKGDGRVRVIHAPVEVLKAAQRCLLDRVLTQVAVTPFAHGFVPDRSIITNALIHAPTARSVLNVDLKDAFPSVSEARVRGLMRWRLGTLFKLTAPHLSSDERLMMCDAATTLCVRDGALPQGAPTSGYLLNLACARLDRLVYSAALRSGLPRVKYTRYADDLTITSSSSEPIPPELIAQIKRAVTRSGFTLNPRKIHTHTDKQRSIVICGVRLNNGSLALPKETIKRYRAQITTAARTAPEDLSTLDKQKILGVISFVRSIYPSPPRPLLKPIESLLAAHQHFGEAREAWLRAPQSKNIKEFRHYSYNGGGRHESES